MTAITFPNSPSSGDTHTAGNGIVYTYDGEKWTSIGTNSAGTWTRSGTTVSLTNAGDDLNVDSGTLFVDASTDRVGIGTSSPSARLQVNTTSTDGQATGTVIIRKPDFTSGSQNHVAFQINNATQGNGIDLGLFTDSGGNYGSFLNIPSASLGFDFRTGESSRIRIDSSGRVGVGTTSPDASLTITKDAAVGLSIRSADSNFSSLLFGVDTSSGFNFITSSNSGSGTVRPLTFRIGASEAVRIDASSRLLVGTSTGVSAETPSFEISGFPGTPSIYLRRAYGSLAGSNDLGIINFAGDTPSAGNNIGASIKGQADGTWSAGDYPGKLVFSTCADGSSSPTERMRINSQGSARIGGSGDPGSYHIIEKPGVALGTRVLTVSGSEESIRVYNASVTANPNGAAMVLWVRSNGTTSRSINASGTINASGADYAEYMIKAGSFTITKGAICGITANGLLTVNYDDAVSFVVKSTNPSYVGGDTWGAGFDDDPEGLEAARQTVDRIAFAGQVPVNVMDATPGQYIVPVEVSDGGIEGVAKDEADLTLAEYMRAVGKVIAIEDDGRARIIVKVA